MTDDWLAWAAILGMAAATWATRISGFWVMRLIPEGGAVKRGLGHLPGALVMAILAPMALDGGWAAPTAIAVAVLLGRLGAATLLSLAGAVGAVALLRLAI